MTHLKFPYSYTSLEDTKKPAPLPQASGGFARNFAELADPKGLKHFFLTRPPRAGAWGTLRSLVVLFCLCASLPPHAAFGLNGNPLIENSFDLGAGGASLTRATQEGIFFANPAQLAYGNVFLRLNLPSISVLTARESIDLVQGLGGGSDEAAGEAELIERLESSPVALGLKLSLSLLGTNWGFGASSRVETDFSFKEFGSRGLPEFQIRTLSVAAVSLAGAVRLPALPWWALGLHLKQLRLNEQLTLIDLSEAARLENPASIVSPQTLLSTQSGAGLDIGSLWFFRSRSFDALVALKVDDVGNTRLAGSGAPDQILQTIHAGVGLTLHTSADALHLALDYRDVGQAYDLPLFKRLRAGVKATLRTYIGVAAGIRDGRPSAALALDLIFLRLQLAAYGVELGNSPNVDSRTLLEANITTGFEF